MPSWVLYGTLYERYCVHFFLEQDALGKDLEQSLYDINFNALNAYLGLVWDLYGRPWYSVRSSQKITPNR
jgi:hypothetical protein